MRQILRISLFVSVFLAGIAANAQLSNEYIVAARRMGTIEFIDPANLHTVSSVNVYVPADSAGLGGVFLDPDGRTLYIEGPIGPGSPESNACCWLYAIDIATLQAKKVAGIGGTESRRAFVSDGPGSLRARSNLAGETAVLEQSERIALPDSNESGECHVTPYTNNFTIGTQLYVYEVFGGKLDRRDCGSNFSGGGWILDASTRRALTHFASELYFWQLVPNSAGSELYGITSEGTTYPPPAGLVRIDSVTGKVLQYRALDTDYWWITAGRLSLVPSGNVSLPQ